MIFDVVTIAVLFHTLRVLSRLIGKGRGDVLDYVSREDSALI